MKVNKKICIMILTGIYIFFISIFNVKALTYEWIPRNVYSAVGSNFVSVTGTKTTNDGDFNPYGMDSYVMQAYGTGLLAEYNLPNGTGTLSFAVGLKGQQAGQLVTNVPSARVLFNSGTQVAYCNSNLTNVYGDMVIINYFCPGYYKGDNTYNDLRLSFDMEISTYMKVGLSKSVAIYGDGTDLSSIENSLNQDISQSDKDAPNQSEYNSAKQQEDNIIQSISNVSANDITFSQDLQASNKIWDTTTRFLNTNAKVMGLVISILSIGIIKLIMNR